MSTDPATMAPRSQHRFVSALAVAVLLVRMLFATFPDGMSGIGAGVSHAGPVHANDSLANHSHPHHSDEGDRQHGVCHFCRFQDAVLPPPASKPVLRTLPPVAVLWLPSMQRMAPALDVFVAFQPRAPPRSV